MLSRFLDPTDGLPRERVVWLVLAALVAAQLLALVLVCSHQVRKAEARRAAWQVQQLASADCLQYLARATIARCAPAAFGAPAAAQADVAWR